MKNKFRRIFKYTLSLLLLLSIVVGDYNIAFASENIQDKKAIILIMDEVSLDEIVNSNTPNIDILLENGSIGFMNTRSRSSLANRGSTHLSLGMGVRTLASTQGGLAFENGEMDPEVEHNLVPEGLSTEEIYKLYMGKNPPKAEIINIAIGDIERTALDITPNNEVGAFGKIARENKLNIGLVGNSDFNKPARESTLIAMDENGVIPFGSINSDLLVTDKSILGGIKLDEKKLLNEIDRILPKTQILFIDYGDTVRVQKIDRLGTDDVREEQKYKSIERADMVLGEVMNRVDMEETLFMIITPNPSRKMINEGNFGLTPVIVSGENMGDGLLTSKTTRREGIVTNFDFAPTILNFFNIEKQNGFVGENMETISNDKGIETLFKNQSEFLYLRRFRKIFHWAYIILVGLSLLGLYIPIFTRLRGLPKRFLDYMSMTTIAIPLTMMTVSIFGYKSIVFDLIYVFLGAFLIGYILDKILKDKYMVIGTIGFLTSILLLIDVFFIKELMIISPLGSDAIAGGRFYGIGNDYMGILLGNTLLGIFIYHEKYNFKKSIMLLFTLIYMGIIILGLSPFVGANMGGTLSAMFIALLMIIFVLERDISFKKIIMLGLIVVLGILLIAGIDVLFNPNPTHAGKAIQALFTGGGFGKLFEIIEIKLRQVFWNIAYASWNIILFSEMILMFLLYRRKKYTLEDCKEKNPRLFIGFKLILFGSVVIFLFNDTGTIAAALNLINLFIPLGMILKEKRDI